MQPRASVWPTLLALCLACSGSSSPGGGALSGEYDLGDGVSVSIAQDGSLTLLRDGEATWATAPGEPFRGRAFEEDVSANLGMWLFERTSESDTAYGTLADVRETTAGVEVDYASTTGAIATLSLAREGGATALTLALPANHDAVVLPIACDEEGTFHGWGEQTHRTDQKGHAFRLFVSEQGIGRTGTLWSFTGDETTTYFPMPWYLDARGFGVLFDTDYRTNVDLCLTDPDVATVEVTSGEPLTWLVMDGPEPLDVLGQLGDVVGRPKAPPDWAYGTWICMQGGETSVRDQVDFLEDNDIPATVLWVQDWAGRRQNAGGGYGVQWRWVPDEGELYPDISGFFEELHGRGYKVVGYANSFIDPILDHWDDMEDQGLLPLDPETGDTYSFLGPRTDQITVADFTNPATQEYAKAYLKAAVTDIGLDGWMADFAEWLPIDAQLHSGEDARAVHNRYPEMWQRITREVMDEVRPDGDWLMFARSGWTGVHDVAMIHWAGDQEADWEETDGLPTVVPSMLTLSLSGQPFVTHDIAGFSGGPSTPELYWRWTELGAFSPYMRTHDGNERDENWRYDKDEDTVAHFRAMARVHEALAPELQALAATAAQTSAPLVRALFLDYPNDPETWPLSDQYLLGPDLLVAPITVEGATSREAYFPEGDWFNVWTSEPVSGPGWHTVDGPIGQPPVFSRGADRADLREAAAG